jgi:hypothetical protein
MTTKAVNGALSIAQLSSVTKQPKISVWRSVGYLVGLGTLGVILHASFRIPMHLPGHHGLEWMALLAFAFISSPRRWVATGVGISATAIAFLPIWGWHLSFSPLFYLASAVLFDMLCFMLPRQQLHRTVVVLYGGLAFAVAGFINFFIGPHGAASNFAWEFWFLMHLGFGLAGTLIGIQLGTWTHTQVKTRS